MGIDHGLRLGFDKGFLLVNNVGVLSNVWATFQSFFMSFLVVFLAIFLVNLATFSKIQGSRVVIGA